MSRTGDVKVAYAHLYVIRFICRYICSLASYTHARAYAHIHIFCDGTLGNQMQKLINMAK